MRTNTLFVLSVMCLFSSFVFAINGNMGGLTQDGSANYPYLIEDFNDFQAFCADPNYWATEVYTRLDCNLDLDPNLPGRMIYSQAPIAGDTNNTNSYIFDGMAYTGNFNGGGHVISKLTINGSYYCGLFGKTDTNSVITNVGIEDADITSDGDFVAALVANNLGSVVNCYAGGNVVGHKYTGCLAGYNGGDITSSHSVGKVSGDSRIGGLAGGNGGSITECYTACDVNDARWIGGLVGYNNQGYISNCYATGDVNGMGSVGGLVGDSYAGIIVDCYATGRVNGPVPVGGLVGSCAIGSITDSFWDIETSGQATGYNFTNGFSLTIITNVTGQKTNQMRRLSTFTDASWDFINSWGIGEGQTYPYLRKYSAADISCDGVVNFVDLAIIADNWLE